MVGRPPIDQHWQERGRNKKLHVTKDAQRAEQFCVGGIYNVVPANDDYAAKGAYVNTFVPFDLLELGRSRLVVDAFVRGWLEGADEANHTPGQVTPLLTDNEALYRDLGAALTRQGLNTVRWATLEDNTAMFGLDGRQPLFDRIFAQASEAWVRRGYIAKSVPSQNAKDDRFLRQIYASSTPPGQQRPQ